MRADFDLPDRHTHSTAGFVVVTGPSSEYRIAKSLSGRSAGTRRCSVAAVARVPRLGSILPQVVRMDPVGRICLSSPVHADSRPATRVDQQRLSSAFGQQLKNFMRVKA